MANNVNFTIKIQDQGSEVLKKISINADDLNKGIAAVHQQTGKLNAEVVNMAQMAQAFAGVQQVVSQLNSVFSDLTAAYQVQIVAETQLQTVMQQRMQATQADLAAIKELCSAQQQLGVIGDEVQISGAQQIATFLNEKASLEALIPAMNNLLAQQKGLNATNQDAVSIGNMMGKAMQGQVDVLQRVGITFTEAQKEVLKFGNESERAAMLAEVIRDNVGEMNAALAATDAGKQKQLENTLGDIKEKLGSLVQGAMPFITIASSMTMAVAGGSQLIVSIKAIVAGFKSKTAATNADTAATRLNNTSVASGSGLMRVHRTLLNAATVALRSHQAAVVAVTAAYTMGLSVAIMAVTELITRLCATTDDAAEAQSLLKESTDAYNQAASDAKGAIDIEIATLSRLIKTNGDASGAVDELNRKYGDALGYHKSAAEWYDVLMTKSAAYCKVLGFEAQAKVTASQRAAKALELEEAKRRQAYLEESGKMYAAAPITTGGSGGAPRTGTLQQTTTKEYAEAVALVAKLNSEEQQLADNFSFCTEQIAAANAELTASTTATDTATMSYEQLTKAIEDNDKKLKQLAPTQTKEINDLKTKNAELKKQQESLGKLLGMNTAKGTAKADKPDLTMPAQLTTIKEIDQAIAYQQDLRSKATVENIANINQEIAKLQELKRQMEQLGVEKEEPKKKEKDAVIPPQDISRLNTMKELQDAVTYYSNLQRTQSSQEIIATQQTIDALNDKLDAMRQLTTLPKMQEDAAKLDGLSGQQLKLQLQLIGLDGVQQKIRDLQSLLNNTENPLDSSQRADVEKMIKSYSGYEKMITKSNLSLRGSWGSLRGVAGGVERITDTLAGNASAWQKVTAVVDTSFIVYDGLKAVFAIIETLTALSAGHAAAKVVEAGAETASATATVASGGASITTSAATTAVIAAETSAWSALAAAKTFAAHAYIPFAGTAIAAGYVAIQQGIIAAAAIPKFANGGIAYGPTLGLFGEYAGAANNPEVVAPLNKLKSLIGDNGGGVGGKVIFEIDGRKLVGILNKESNIRNRG